MLYNCRDKFKKCYLIQMIEHEKLCKHYQDKIPKSADKIILYFEKVPIEHNLSHKITFIHKSWHVTESPH